MTHTQEQSIDIKAYTWEGVDVAALISHEASRIKADYSDRYRILGERGYSELVIRPTVDYLRERLPQVDSARVQELRNVGKLADSVQNIIALDLLSRLAKASLKQENADLKNTIRAFRC